MTGDRLPQAPEPQPEPGEPEPPQPSEPPQPEQPEPTPPDPQSARMPAGCFALDAELRLPNRFLHKIVLREIRLVGLHRVEQSSGTPQILVEQGRHGGAGQNLPRLSSPVNDGFL